MTLPHKGSYHVRFAPFDALPGTEMCERLGGRTWLDSLSPRAKRASKGTSSPLLRARAYARTAPVTSLAIEAGTIWCWINENTNPDPSPYAYTPQPNPTIRIPVLDGSQWRDLTLITRHLVGRLASLPADEVLFEINNAGARNGIRLLPTIDQCHASCSCSSRSSLCRHAATALFQTARVLDAMPPGPAPAPGPVRERLLRRPDGPRPREPAPPLPARALLLPAGHLRADRLRPLGLLAPTARAPAADSSRRSGRAGAARHAGHRPAGARRARR
ncbi:SWIM zinc finger family protein [Streptomyces sp. NPDC002519]